MKLLKEKQEVEKEFSKQEMKRNEVKAKIIRCNNSGKIHKFNGGM